LAQPTFYTAYFIAQKLDFTESLPLWQSKGKDSSSMTITTVATRTQTKAPIGPDATEILAAPTTYRTWGLADFG
jgi:hypothetical protein